MSFSGSHTVAMDAKSRVVFPAAFKREWKFDSDGAITVKMDSETETLVFIPEGSEEWSIPSSRPLLDMNTPVEVKLRIMADHARFAKLQLADNGRIVLTKKMVDCLNLKGKEITFVGGNEVVWAACASRF